MSFPIILQRPPSPTIRQAVRARPTGVEWQDQMTASMFQGSTDLNTNGGQYINVARDLSTVIQHITNEPTRSVISSHENTTQIIPHTADTISRVDEKDSEKYARLMWPKGYGYPLWCPSPNPNLPKEYVERGIGVGDVIIIATSGFTDFLFNICLPADHPINNNRVPNGFQPIAMPDIHTSQECSRSTFLMSNNMKGGVVGNQKLPPLNVASDYHFQCEDNEGAVLILPEGSHGEDILSPGDFKSYIGQHAESWYYYANVTRGREAVNGSIHVVTGHDSCTSWALGAFSHSNLSSSGSVDLQFTATTSQAQVDINSTSEPAYTYHWNQSGPARAKYGPTPVTKATNQTVFVRTFCVELSEWMWEKYLTGSVKVKSILDKTHAKDVMPRSNYVPYRRSTKFLPTRKTCNDHTTDESDTSDDEAYVSIRRTVRNHTDVMHPSRIVTRYLLEKVPDAAVAIVGHEDWLLLKDEGEEDLPGYEKIYQRLEQKFSVKVDNESNTVSLIPRCTLKGKSRLSEMQEQTAERIASKITSSYDMHQRFKLKDSSNDEDSDFSTIANPSSRPNNRDLSTKDQSPKRIHHIPTGYLSPASSCQPLSLPGTSASKIDVALKIYRLAHKVVSNIKSSGGSNKDVENILDEINRWVEKGDALENIFDELNRWVEEGAPSEIYTKIADSSFSRPAGRKKKDGALIGIGSFGNYPYSYNHARPPWVDEVLAYADSLPCSIPQQHSCSSPLEPDVEAGPTRHYRHGSFLTPTDGLDHLNPLYKTKISVSADTPGLYPLRNLELFMAIQRSQIPPQLAQGQISHDLLEMERNTPDQLDMARTSFKASQKLYSRHAPQKYDLTEKSYTLDTGSGLSMAHRRSRELPQSNRWHNIYYVILATTILGSIFSVIWFFWLETESYLYVALAIGVSPCILMILQRRMKKISYEPK